MRMCNRGQNIEKQSHASFDTQLALLAILVDGKAVDIFENEIGLAMRCNARIQQFGNMRMAQPAENAALALKALFGCRAGQRDIHKLDRSLSFESPIAALGEPHRSHAPLADLRHQGVGADSLSGKSG